MTIASQPTSQEATSIPITNTPKEASNLMAIISLVVTSKRNITTTKIVVGILIMDKAPSLIDNMTTIPTVEMTQTWEAIKTAESLWWITGGGAKRAWWIRIMTMPTTTTSIINLQSPIPWINHTGTADTCMMERVTSRDLTTAIVSIMATLGAIITNTGIELRVRTQTTTKSFRRRPPKRPRRSLKQIILKHY